MLKWISQISSSMVSEEKTFLTLLHIPPIPNYSTENCLQFMCLTSYFILNLPSFLSILQISTASTASSACCWSDCPVLHLFPKAQEIKEDFFSLTSRHLHILVTPCLHWPVHSSTNHTTPHKLLRKDKLFFLCPRTKTSYWFTVTCMKTLGTFL